MLTINLAYDRATVRRDHARRSKRAVPLWHKADILIALANVRFRGQSGHHKSGFSPLRMRST
jgi:hypothetical protein